MIPRGTESGEAPGRQGAASRRPVTWTRYRARWVAPITSPPIEDGWVDVAGGVIRAVGSAADARGDSAGREIDLGSVCVLPGLVNAHTHLELSGHRGAVPPARSMPA